ncbi:hypothetical protein EIP91_008824 [Steccherinum ochraceum]|uniref:Uncharacterized protein n=1 Tax=Steccherinum ochraceum TaxID=92696 RepID=A0A4R0R2A0_9APHY|nr:hypothetical protein EIP91_008824 [Steccherinum ochraceum]
MNPQSTTQISDLPTLRILDYGSDRAGKPLAQEMKYTRELYDPLRANGLPVTSNYTFKPTEVLRNFVETGDGRWVFRGQLHASPGLDGDASSNASQVVHSTCILKVAITDEAIRGHQEEVVFYNHPSVKPFVATKNIPTLYGVFDGEFAGVWACCLLLEDVGPDLESSGQSAHELEMKQELFTGLHQAHLSWGQLKDETSVHSIDRHIVLRADTAKEHPVPVLLDFTRASLDHRCTTVRYEQEGGPHEEVREVQIPVAYSIAPEWPEEAVPCDELRHVAETGLDLWVPNTFEFQTTHKGNVNLDLWTNIDKNGIPHGVHQLEDVIKEVFPPNGIPPTEDERQNLMEILEEAKTYIPQFETGQ